MQEECCEVSREVEQSLTMWLKFHCFTHFLNRCRKFNGSVVLVVSQEITTVLQDAVSGHRRCDMLQQCSALGGAYFFTASQIMPHKRFVRHPKAFEEKSTCIIMLMLMVLTNYILFGILETLLCLLLVPHKNCPSGRCA